jgi:hypothetical protein
VQQASSTQTINLSMCGVLVQTLLNCEQIRDDFENTLRIRTKNNARLVETSAASSATATASLQIEYASDFIMPNDKNVRSKVLDIIDTYEFDRLKRFELNFDQAFNFLSGSELSTIEEYFEEYMAEQYAYFLREKSSAGEIGYEFGRSVGGGGCLLSIFGYSSRVGELRDEAVFAEIRRIESVYFGKFDLLKLGQDSSSGIFLIQFEYNYI